MEAAKSIPRRKMEKRNKWMSCEILDLMEERRVEMILGSMKYGETNRKISICADMQKNNG